jgi:cobalt-zinc-cadmium efflux system outer membrane protein
MKTTLFFIFLLVLSFAPIFSFAQDGSSLSLQQATELAVSNNPELRAFQIEVEARDARILQAGAIPNPELQVLAEDIGGSGKFEGFSNSQTTLQMSQRLELGSKRSTRRTVASLHRDVAKFEYEVKRREMIANVRQAYYEVLHAQQRSALIREMVALSKRFSGAVVDRIQAGKVPPIEELKANATVASVEIELSRALRDLEIARTNLAVLLGKDNPDFSSVVDESSTEILKDYSLEELLNAMDDHVLLQRATTEVAEREKVVALEKTRTIPDLFITTGIRKLESSDDHAFLIGATIPVPLFDRNKGAISEATSRLRKAETMKTSVELDLKNSLIKAYSTYRTTRSEVEALRSKVVPANQTSFDAIEEGYRFGKYGYLDVLEAQRSLFHSRLQYLQVLTDWHIATIELERITGRSILQSSNVSGVE